MTALEKYQAQRSLISEALNLAGVAETLFEVLVIEFEVISEGL